MSTLPLRAHIVPADASFWQRPFVRDVLPLVTSLVLHLGIIALALLTYRAVHVMVDVSNVPPVIPQSTTPITMDSPVPQFRGLDNDPTRQAQQDKIPDVPDSASGLSNNRSLALTLTATKEGDHTLDDPIALGLSRTFNAGTSGVSGTEGGLAPFGVAGGGGRVDFYIHGTGVNRVAFVCDSSGSMLNKFDTLRTQLRKAIDRLKPVQSFDVIFFAEDRCLALDAALLPAVPEVKLKAYDFLEKSAPHGTSDPIPGLQAAFATHPELIYILTDGDFPNNAQVLEELRKLNKDKRVKINTIAFMDRGEAYEKLLKQIADENGGAFKFVSDQELDP